jgi:hypothetical protein
MMDSFLLEGVRVLYRYGLALIKGYKLHIKKREYQTGIQFWRSVQADAASVIDNSWLSGEAEGLGNLVEDSQSKFTASGKPKYLSEDIHAQAYELTRGINKRRMNISSNKLQGLLAEGESALGSRLNDPLEMPLLMAQLRSTRRGSEESAAGGGSMTSSSQNRLSREGFDGPPSQGSGSINRGPSNLSNDNRGGNSSRSVNGKSKGRLASTPSRTHLLAAQSAILDHNTALQLLMLCPFGATASSNRHRSRRFTISGVGLHLVFSTARNGWDLSTLYEKTQGIQPCVVVVKALGSKGIVGAFVTASLAPPSLRPRGDGQCFCFRLDTREHLQELSAEQLMDIEDETSHNDFDPQFEPAKYAWAGLAQADGNGNGNGSGRSDRRLSPGAAGPGPSSTLTQFAVCAPNFLSFGGSAAHGTNALRLDDDLKTCHSGPSDTYGNGASLLSDGSGSGRRAGSFPVENVEVFCNRATYEAIMRDKKEERFTKRVSSSLSASESFR